jgi:hypothetical protein
MHADRNNDSMISSAKYATVLLGNKNSVAGQGHLADDKLAFRLVEIVYGNFEVELEIVVK